MAIYGRVTKGIQSSLEEKVPDSSKSNLHRRALVTADLVDGARIIQFNLHEGVLGEYIVRGEVVTQGSGRAIKLAPVGGGAAEYHYLYDLGVEPNAHGFNDTNFTVAAQDRGQLPAATQRTYPHPDFS